MTKAIFIGHAVDTINSTDTYTPGMLSVDSDTKNIIVYDGKTPGGVTLTTKGKDGTNGKDGVSITGATVTNGNLIITKSDGTTVDAGKVSSTATTTTAPAVGGPPVVGSAPNPFAPIIVNAPPAYKAASIDDGVELSLDNIAVQLPASGTRSLQIRVLSGTMNTRISGECFWCPGNYTGTFDSRYWTGDTLTTTYQQIFTWSFPWAGDKAVYLVQDFANRRLYRITLIIGPGYKKNFIVMERLV